MGGADVSGKSFVVICLLRNRVPAEDADANDDGHHAQFQTLCRECQHHNSNRKNSPAPVQIKIHDKGAESADRTNVPDSVINEDRPKKFLRPSTFFSQAVELR